MTNPTLGLGITAGGVAQVAALAKSVGDLTANLRELAQTAGGGGDLKNLSNLSNQISLMRREMGVAVQELKTTLQEGFEKAFSGAAQSAREGGARVAKEVSAANVSIRAESVKLGDSLSAVASGRGLGAAEAVSKMQAELRQLPEAVKATADATMLEQIKFEAKQKEAWVSHMQALRERMDSERSMMDGAVAQFRAIQQKQVDAQLAQNARMKDAWLQSKADLALRLKEEATMMDAAVAQFRRQTAEKEALALKNSTTLATNNASGPFSSIQPGSFGQLRNLPEEASKASRSIEGLTKVMNDAHSAVRGLASGFDAMFLTWGNIVPLLAGAAISNAFVQVIKQGAEFEQTMLVIGHVAGESATDVDKLAQASIDLARSGPFGPNEVAKAVKTLALAGLDAKQQMEALKPTLDFSMVGEMPLEKASETLVAISTAFGFTAKDFGVVSDIIAKTAAVSMASVEGMASSFKNASSIAQVYKVTIDDVALSLALMAQVGIKNQEAGTAVRAMYTALATGGKQAQAILHDALKVDVIDNATKAMRPLSDIMMDMTKSLSKMPFSDQLMALQKISAQRGMKTVAADLTAYITKVQEAGGTTEEFVSQFKKMQDEIAQAPGFSAMAAIGLSTSSLNQMKEVAASFQAALVTAFKNVSTEVQITSQYIQKVFQSQGFQEGLRDIITGTASVVQWLIENVKLLEALALGYALGRVAVTAYSLAAGTLAVVQGVLTASTTAAAAADVGLATATTAVGVASAEAAVGVGVLNAAFGVIAIVLAAAAAAVIMFGDKSKSAYVDIAAAQEKAAAASRSYSTTVMDGMDKEIDRLEKVAKERANGATTEAANAKVQSDLVRDTLERHNAEERAVVELSLSYKKLAIDKIAASEYALTAGGEKELKRLKEDYAQASFELQGMFTRQDRAMTDFYAKQSKLVALSVAEHAAAKKEIEDNNKKHPTGTTPLNLNNEGLFGDKELSSVKRLMDDELEVIHRGYTKQLEELSARNKAGEISEGVYLAELLGAGTAVQKATDDVILKQQDAFNEAYNKRFDQIKAKLGKKPEAMKAALDSLNETAKAFDSSINKKQADLEIDTDTKRVIAMANLSLETKKLTEADNKYWETQDAKVKKQADLANAKRDYANVTEEVRARMEAEAKITDDTLPRLDALQAAYNTAREKAQDFRDVIENQAGSPSADQETMLGALNKQVALLAAMLQRANDQVARLKVLSGDAAVTEVKNKDIENLRKEAQKVADDFGTTFSDAILTGGKDGGKKLRDWLVNQFKQPIKILLQAAVQPIGNAFAQFLFPGVGQLRDTPNSTGAGGSLFSSGLGLFSSANSANGMFTGNGMFSGVGTSVSNGFASLTGNSVLAGGPVTFPGAVGPAAGAALPTTELTAAEASDIGGGVVAGTEAGGLAATETGLAAIGPVGWVALAALAAYAIFSKHGGGPKQDGTFGTTYSGIGATDNSLASVAAPFGQGLQDQYSGLAKQFGGQAAVSFGLAISRDPKGTSPTFLEVAGTKNGQQVFSNLNRDVGRSDDELTKAVQDAVTSALLSGLKASDLKPKFADYFNSISDDATADVKQAAITLATNVQTIEAAFKQLGPSFDYIGDQAVTATAKLIDAGGGMQTLAANLSSYFDNFYTDAEKRKTTAQKISDTLGAAGFDISADTVLATTRDRFRELVEKAAQMGPAGEKAYLALLSVNAAFASIVPVVDAATQAHDAYTAALSGLDAAFTNVSNAVAAEHKRIDAEYQANITLVQARIDSITASVTKLTSLSDLLKGTLSSFHTDTTVGIGRADASAQISAALAAAKATGVLPDADTLRDALTVVAQPSEDLHKSFLDYIVAFDRQASDVSELGDLTGIQLDVQQALLTTAQDQLKALDAAHQADSDRLDAILAQAQLQVDAAKGTTQAVLSLSDALNALAASVTSVKVTAGVPGSGAPGSGGIGTGVGQFTQAQVVSAILTSQAQGFSAADIQTGAARYGVTGTAFTDAMHAAGVPGFAVGGFASGAAMVGEKGPEFADFATPARVYTADQTKGMFDNSGNRAIAAALLKMEQRLANIEDAANDTEKNTRRLDTNFTAVMTGQATLTTEPA